MGMWAEVVGPASEMGAEAIFDNHHHHHHCLARREKSFAPPPPRTPDAGLDGNVDRCRAREVEISGGAR